MAASLIFTPKTSLTGKMCDGTISHINSLISSVIPKNLVLLTKSQQSGPKSAHIRPTMNISKVRAFLMLLGNEFHILGPWNRI